MHKTCRICTRQDASVMENVSKFIEPLRDLTQMECKIDPGQPKWICVECFQNLCNAIAFRNRCREVEEQYDLDTKFYEEVMDEAPLEVEYLEEVEENEIEDKKYYVDEYFVPPPRPMSPESEFLNSLGRTLSKPTTSNIKEKSHQFTKTIKKEKIGDYEYSINVKEEYFNNDFMLDDFPAITIKGRSSSIPRPKIPNEGPFVCEPCGVSYTNKRSYNTHFHFKHRHADRRYICPHCGKIYKKSDQFRGHLNTHLAVLPYCCDICGARFARKPAIQKHMMVHTGERNYFCQYCPKTYAFPIDLKRHLTSHTGVYIYTCKWCGKGYNRKKPLLEHEAEH